jgi:hypothetical protein
VEVTLPTRTFDGELSGDVLTAFSEMAEMAARPSA